MIIRRHAGIYQRRIPSFCIIRDMMMSWHGSAFWINGPSPIATFMGPTWGPPGADRTQEGPMLAPWILLSGFVWEIPHNMLMIHGVDISFVVSLKKLLNEGFSCDVTLMKKKSWPCVDIFRYWNDLTHWGRDKFANYLILFDDLVYWRIHASLHQMVIILLTAYVHASGTPLKFIYIKKKMHVQRNGTRHTVH